MLIKVMVIGKKIVCIQFLLASKAATRIVYIDQVFELNQEAKFTL